MYTHMRIWTFVSRPTCVLGTVCACHKWQVGYVVLGDLENATALYSPAHVTVTVISQLPVHVLSPRHP